MDKVAIIFRALELIPRFIPKSKPPVIDYMSLKDKMPQYEFPSLRATEVKVKTAPEPSWERELQDGDLEPEAEAISPQEESEGEVGTACLSCSRSHLSTVSGALNESLRFARDEGIASPEVQRRIMMAEDELNMLERIDLASDALEKATPVEKQIAEEYLPRIRKLRQDIGQITTLEQLQKTSAEASVLGQEFRLRHLQARGVDLNPVLELAKKVQAGDMTMDEAKAELKTILPDEE